MNAQNQNSKDMWKLIRKNKSPTSSLLTCTDFFEYFKDLGNPSDVSYVADDDIYERIRTHDEGLLNDSFQELNDVITHAEVIKAIKELKSGKSAGPDLLINEFFVNTCETITDKLVILFNIIFSSGHFPLSWVDGVVIPIHKKGSKNTVDNYRGITLLSVLGKLFTRILNNRLNFWAESYDILIEEQAGFRSNRSTVDNLFVLHSIINSALQNGKKLFCAFLDFRKAFDYLNRDCLWFKLLDYGLRGNIFNVIRSMYCEVKTRVRYGGETSNTFNSFLGVRQGESLSPLLFSMYANDMREMLHESGSEGITVDDLKLCLLLYADDSVLIAESRLDLQNSLDSVHDYCQRWKLFVNILKTKIVVFRKGGRLSIDAIWFYGDSILEVVEHFSYLGIMFSSTGKFSGTQQDLADRGLRALFSIQGIAYELIDPKPELLCMLFDRLVLPVLLYSCELWGFHTAVAVERVHLKFCKWVLKVAKSTTNEMVYGELGRCPLILEKKVRIVKYWLKIVHRELSPLVQKIYKIMLHTITANNTIVNWAALVRDMLFNLGFGYAWMQQGVTNRTYFISLFKQRLRDQYIQQWFTSVSTRSSCSIYKNITNHFRCQNYFHMVTNCKHRISLIRFRTKNHSLPNVIQGRGRNRRPYNERLCPTCSVLGDEFHCLFECENTRHIRHVLPRYYSFRPNMFKFSSLLSSEEPSVLRKLAKFLYLRDS